MEHYTDGTDLKRVMPLPYNALNACITYITHRKGIKCQSLWRISDKADKGCELLELVETWMPQWLLYAQDARTSDDARIPESRQHCIDFQEIA